MSSPTGSFAGVTTRSNEDREGSLNAVSLGEGLCRLRLHLAERYSHRVCEHSRKCQTRCRGVSPRIVVSIRLYPWQTLVTT
jgi:hypothetical protein